ncbi:MAG TPA: phosphoribosylaminoimidazolesuccinocarboxamide synthase [Jatrophihabitans sp.]|jgi:phosphoribosylaminoimidazole-succinocarboxamide synthase|uniref:phosphoribosylaminoimidazolesuccinocarboxamide synthase n=1 Tax=Jatrophihabitans sp. TaxID=1932789 RepID=UPI002E085627|nr:phosphoribosylaminoimidazolesuccinocarboxamide synthase [Jatrophihabitans sp.]
MVETPDGLTHVHSGKVRDLYRSADGRLVMVASDRMSAFDFVLDSPIPDKGRILTAMSVWWFAQLDALVANHLESVDDPIIPSEWQGRTMVCTPLDMVPVEAVARGYLTGSGLLDYRATGEVCGVALPPGLVDGDRLPEPIFTPATKAAIGEHDENVSFETITADVGPETAAEVRDLTLGIYSFAAELAAGRGIILADTKFEFGRHPDTGALVLGDEVLTPDSSRFWPADRWTPGRPQPSFDKQFVRNWLLSPESGWDRASGEAPPPLPDDVVAATRERYVEAYERLTGLSFADWPG